MRIDMSKPSASQIQSTPSLKGGRRDAPEGASEAPKSAFRRWHLPVLFLFALGTFLVIHRHNAPAPFQKEEGAVFGTFYHITYQSHHSLQDSIDARLAQVDASLSMFNPQSIISRINQNQDVQVDSLFRRVFQLSRLVSQATGGAFDITVAPLVNAWGFGFKHDALPDSAQVDSLRALVGWERVTLTDDGHIHKADPRIVLDCSAVAKGFGVDVVADYLRSQGVINFMVEIGGEVIVSGTNPKGDAWRVGVNKPDEDSTGTNHQLQTVLQLTDRAMATSGNYRNFYVAGGRKVAHTIDPHTGYPVQHSLLSATVLAPTCAEADAFATSFMVMGLDQAKQVLVAHPQLQVYLIYADSSGALQTYSTIEP